VTRRPLTGVRRNTALTACPSLEVSCARSRTRRNPSTIHGWARGTPCRPTDLNGARQHDALPLVGSGDLRIVGDGVGRAFFERFGDETALALEELSQCVDGSGDVQRELEATELAARINDFVMALPQAERRVFLCRYWYMDSMAEIAIRFGFSVSKVKSMLHRIRQRLRQTLEQEGLL